MRLMEYTLSKEEAITISTDGDNISIGLCFQEVTKSITEEHWKHIIESL